MIVNETGFPQAMLQSSLPLRHFCFPCRPGYAEILLTATRQLTACFPGETSSTPDLRGNLEAGILSVLAVLCRPQDQTHARTACNGPGQDG